MTQTRTKILGLFLVTALLLSSAGTVIAAPSDDLSYGDDSDVPNPYIDVDTMTVASHPVDQGTSVSAVEGYYDDNGDWVDDPEWVVNTTSSVSSGDNVNPYTFKPGHINESDFDVFPRTDDGENDASALDASEWSTEGGAAGNMAVTDTSVASGADAVSISTSSMSDTNVARAVYNNWTSELDSDEDKRVLQLGMDVDTLDSAARVNVSVVDESGDYKDVIFEPDATDRDVNTTTAVTATGDHVYQIKLSALSLTGSGTFDNIESLEVTVKDADATVEFSWIDLAKKGKTTLGKKKVDTLVDSDDDYDQTNSTYNSTGRISVYDLDTLADDFDDATINDLEFPAKYPASEIQGDEGEEDAYVLEWEDAGEYPGYDQVLNVSYRLSTTSEIDLTHNTVDVQWEQELPEGRYIEAGAAEGVGENGNISAQSLTSATLASSGDIVDLDASASAGTYYVAGFEVKLTDDEASTIKNVSDSGGAAAPPDSGGSGGWIDSAISAVMSPVGAFVSVVTVILGFLRLRKD